MNYKMTDMRSWYLLFLMLVVSFGATAQSYTERFDVNELGNPKPWRVEGNGNERNVLSTDYKLSGNKSFKSYLPTMVYSNPRSELRFNGTNGIPKGQDLMKTWGVSMAIYVPNNYVPDVNEEIVIQWHGLPDAEDTYINPPVAILFDGYDIKYKLRYYTGSPSTKDNQVTKKFTAGRVTPGKWHYFVVDIHWDYRLKGNGFVKVYMKKGSKPSKSNILLDYKGPIASNDAEGPYFKAGIYKPMWKLPEAVQNSKKAGVKSRLLYYEDIRIQKGGILSGSSSSGNNDPEVSISGQSSISLPTNSVTLTANASDSDGSIASYKWTKVSGPASNQSGQNSRKLNVIGMVNGTYWFKVEVTDNDGAKSTATKSVKVGSGSSSGGSSSIISAGKDFTVDVSQKSFLIKPTISSDVKVNNIFWRQESGPDVTRKKEGNNLRVSNIKVGTYEFRVRLEHSGNQVAFDYVTVKVTSGQASTDEEVSAGPDQTVSLSDKQFLLKATVGQGIKADKIFWRQESGPNVTTTKEGNNLRVTNIKEGSYEFRVRLEHSGNKVALDYVKVNVTSGGGNSNSVVSAGPDKTVSVSNKQFLIKPTIKSGIKVDKVFWRKESGPSANLAKEGNNLRVSQILKGKYVFRIRLEYDGNKVAFDYVTVTVTGATSMASNIDSPDANIRNFTTSTDSVMLLNNAQEGLKVRLRNVNGVKLSIEDFNGELNTEAIRHGMYQYDVMNDKGAVLQKGTLLIY